MKDPFEFVINNFTTDFISSKVALLQIVIILLAFAVTYILSKTITNSLFSKSSNSDLFSRSAKRIIGPVVMLIILFITDVVLGEYQSTNILAIAIALVNAMIIIRLSISFVRYVLKPSATLKTYENIISSIVWILVALHFFGVLSILEANLTDIVIHMGSYEFSLWLVIQVFFGIALSIIAAILLGQFIENKLMKVKKLDMNIRVMLSKVIRITLYALAIIITLSSLGVNLTFLSVFGGAFGVGLGFGLQKIASNYISGLIILFDKSIHIGDILTIGSHYGEVTIIRPRYTVLRKLDSVEVLIPNESLISENIVNHTFSDRKSKVTINIQISYKSSIDKASEIMLNALKEESRVLDDPEPTVIILGFGESGIDLMIAFYIVDPEEGSLALKSDIYKKLWNEFQREGIEIPYPYRTIEIVNLESNKTI